LPVILGIISGARNASSADTSGPRSRQGSRLHASGLRCAPGYWSEVHHVDEWAAGGCTEIDKLTFACAANHKLAGKGWKTRKLPDGRTEWIPPPHLDHGQPRTNDYHRPERLFDDGGTTS
jgi:hypothetical protein